jgi:hypothetical protein
LQKAIRYTANRNDLGTSTPSAAFFGLSFVAKVAFISVYGLADHSNSSDFLDELEAKVLGSRHPVVVVGDFTDKKNSNIK